MSLFADNEMKSINGIDLEGKLLVMNPKYLIKTAQDRKYQVSFAYYGNGCDPNLFSKSSSGKAVYVYDLSTCEECEYGRNDFIGYIEEEQLSLEQKAILVKVKEKLKNSGFPFYNT